MESIDVREKKMTEVEIGSMLLFTKLRVNHSNVGIFEYNGFYYVSRCFDAIRASFYDWLDKLILLW